MKNRLCLLSRGGLLVLLMLTFTFCKNDTAENPPPAEPTVDPTLKVPRFEKDSAYQYVARQVSFGPRVVNTEAHRQTKEWLVAKLKEMGLQVIEQDFTATAYTGDKLQSTNIIGQYNPEQKNRILLAAHWDSRPFTDSPLYDGDTSQPVLGADDGASGVGVLLEIARQLQANPIKNMGVDIVFFDAEDYGESGGGDANSWALGSQHYARNLPGQHKPRYGILLDMVGARNARFAVEQYSMRFAPELVRKVWQLADQMGYSNYFVDADGGAITDDHYFVSTISGIPMIDIINRQATTETGFGAHWHTPDDTMDIIDERTLRAVGQVLLATIYREAAGKF